MSNTQRQRVLNRTSGQLQRSRSDWHGKARDTHGTYVRPGTHRGDMSRAIRNRLKEARGKRNGYE